MRLVSYILFILSIMALNPHATNAQTQTRTVTCRDTSTGLTVSDSLCNPAAKPAIAQTCLPPGPPAVPPAVPACFPDGFTFLVGNGQDDAICLSSTVVNFSGTRPEPGCCSGFLTSAASGMDTIGAGNCYATCSGPGPALPCPAHTVGAWTTCGAERVDATTCRALAWMSVGPPAVFCILAGSGDDPGEITY